jgi:hypothetical protein
LTRLLVPLVGIGLTVFWIWALVDAIRVPDDSMYNEGNKLLWVIVIVLTSFIGAIIYLIIGRPPAEYRRR